jgi:hypothetical protein
MVRFSGIRARDAPVAGMVLDPSGEWIAILPLCGRSPDAGRSPGRRYYVLDMPGQLDCRASGTDRPETRPAQIIVRGLALFTLPHPDVAELACMISSKGVLLMKVLSMVVAMIGILALLIGLVLKMTGQAHGLTILGIGAILLVLGLIGAFALKPKNQAS